MSGGNNGGLESYLPMALAIGATVATGGAAAPAIGTMLGAEAGTLGAAALGAGAMGAGSSALGGIMQGKSAGDILKNSLISGTVGAATAGALGGTGGVDTGVAGGTTGAPIEFSQAEQAAGLSQGAPQTNMQFEYTPNNEMAISQTPSPTAGDQAVENLGQNNDYSQTARTAPSQSTPYDYKQATGLQKNLPGMASSLAGGMFQPGNGLIPIASPGVPKGLQFHFNEDPNAMYQPAIAPNYNGVASMYPQGPTAQRPMGYADGGTVEQMSLNNTNNTNQSFPQSGTGGLGGNNRYQSFAVAPTDTATDTYSGAMKFAAGGGIASYARGGDLGSYSDGGRMLKGPGDGMSDSIPAKIGHHQPARLADSEFVIPADVVSHLGNGSSDAGAKQLYAMMDRVRKARTGRKEQGKQIKPEKHMPA